MEKKQLSSDLTLRLWEFRRTSKHELRHQFLSSPMIKLNNYQIRKNLSNRNILLQLKKKIDR
ncbi:hypothetical protein T03_559 [Trichinella britovi]|uniref:Uncharacterized protein n=1 Tax=Trichinella britovi TaxID=45882 RepID=A0A0V1CSN4_TRIBR|nr:hypothetical protein T03_559 [Trichinella britovi]